MRDPEDDALDLVRPLPRVRKPFGALAVLCRCCSPSLLLLSFLLLPLPFLAVRCEPANQPPMTWATQTGIQVLTGDVTPGQPAPAFGPPPVGAPFAPFARPPALGGQAENVGPCAGLVVALVLVLSAAACGLALPGGLWRLGVAGGLLLAAHVAVYVQLAVGFPVETYVRARVADAGADAAFQLNPRGNLAPLGRAGVNMAALSVRVRYSPWFWMWLAVIHLGLLALAGETACFLLAAQPVRRRYRPAG